MDEVRSDELDTSLFELAENVRDENGELNFELLTQVMQLSNIHEKSIDNIRNEMYEFIVELVNGAYKESDIHSEDNAILSWESWKQDFGDRVRQICGV